MIRAVLALFLAAGICHSQPAPTVTNGKLETRAVSEPLSNQFHTVEASAASPLWMAYSVPSVPNQGTDCGEARHNNIARLEGSESIIVLYRFENHALDRVRIANPDCEFDAGGFPFIFLTGVRPAESVELLTGLVRSWAQAGRKPHFESLITALALHRDTAADGAPSPLRDNPRRCAKKRCSGSPKPAGKGVTRLSATSSPTTPTTGFARKPPSTSR